MTTLQKPQILNIKTVAKSTSFEIQSVDLKFANGEHRTYERFRPGKYAAVMVVAIDGEDLLLVREYAVGTERYELGFVKGRMDAGETPEQSANRELQEEIGLEAKSWVHLRTINMSVGFMNNPMHILLAQDFYPSKLEGDEPEPLEMVRIPLAKIDDLLADPEFNEEKNLTALYLVRDYLQRK
ncbi:ADP compounds hydrolase NudE [Aggregatibacter actinomycetemcomitans]|uniref:ADP compounds hydrolase NudE n=1 Tax=Aggregatibacter actinomycetemcomitans TaxID=714 RepID=UPI000680C260|nr:ADP compounds hydrolase NudE [Aggregatibacter actinomycetemcomitans]TQE40933.1 ADP compounds hydrolase NudE [Aggregatibacter actinomycetemcomitans]